MKKNNNKTINKEIQTIKSTKKKVPNTNPGVEKNNNCIGNLKRVLMSDSIKQKRDSVNSTMPLKSLTSKFSINFINAVIIFFSSRLSVWYFFMVSISFFFFFFFDSLMFFIYCISDFVYFPISNQKSKRITN